MRRSDPLERMRRGNPVPEPGMPAIEPLLERLDGPEQPAPAARGRRRRSRRPHGPAALGLLVAMLGAAGALAAASGLLTGEPVKPRDGTTFSPTRGVGIPVKGTARLLALRAPDPAGGPDWGMRVLSTTRGLGCVQIGRVVDGRLGVLGQDGAFANDGKFHELPATVLEQANCALLDLAGRTFLAVSVQGIPASVMPTACAVRKISQSIQRRFPKPIEQPPLCAPENVRVLLYGLLGPRARSITYPGRDRRPVTVPTVGKQGAYLLVLAPDPRRPPNGQYSVASGPGSGLTSVRYRDGHVCKIRSPALIGGAKPCPPVGYRKPRRGRVTDAQVAAPVRTRLRDFGGDNRRLELSFTARLPVRSGRGSYDYFVALPRGRICSGGGSGGASPGNVAAGATVRFRVQIPKRCPGQLRGRVTYTFRSEPSASPGIAGPFGGRQATVGTFTVRVPRP